MSVYSLSLRDLQYVVAVADQRHFRKAAEACHVSQPALSAQIRKIEDQLGAVIFERTRRSVALTEIGESVVQQARIVLEEAGKLGELVGRTRSPLSGNFRLGAIATLGPYLIPHILKPLRKQFPSLQLVLREGLTNPLIEQLKHGGLDAVLCSPTFPEEGLRVLPLFVEPFVIAAPSAHALAKREKILPSDLSAEDMVLLEDGHCLKDQTLEICPANRRGNFRQLHATSVETLRHLVASGLGYTLLPQLAVREDGGLAGLIKYRKLDGARPFGRVVALVCRERFAGMRDIDRLAEFLQEHRPAGTLAVDKGR